MATEQRRENREAHDQGQAKNGPRTEDIAVAAYYIAERRGFAGDQHVDDWLSAERELGSAPTGTGGDEIAARGLVVEDIEPDQVVQWANKLNVTPQELRVAIQRVGPSSKAVRQFLHQERPK
jgi:hypothetical protein